MIRASSAPLALVAVLLAGFSPASLLALPGEQMDPGGPYGEAPMHAEKEMRRLGELLEEEVDQPRALLHLADLARLIDDVVDLSGMRGILAQAALDRRAHPEVRAYARLLAARTEWRRGRFPRARSWMEPLGMLHELWFVGPFDNEGGGGFDVVWPPEAEELGGEAPDESRVYEGKEGPASWRALPDVFPLGYVSLSALLDPDREVVVYLRAAVESEKAQPAALRMGTPGATKVWLNGKEVFSSRADHPARFDQHAVPLTLARGTNVLFLKLTQRQGGLGFYLRLTDETGAALSGVEMRPPDAPVATRPPPRREPAPASVDTVLDALTGAAGDGDGGAEGIGEARGREAPRASDGPPDLAEALFDAARILALRHPFDRTERAHLERAREARDAALSALTEAAREDRELTAGVELARFHHLVARYEDDHNRRRLALEDALEADASHLGARLDLGLHYLGQGKPREALPHLRRVVESTSGHMEAALALSDAKSQLTFPEVERRDVARLAASHPRAQAVILREASIALGEGRPKEAVRRLRVGVGLYPGDRSLRSSLSSALLDLGRLDEAVETMLEGIRFEPAAIFGRLALADLLSANRRIDEAEALYEEAATLNPALADVHFRRALHHLRHGFRPAAEEHLEKAFARRPQDPRISELRTMLAEEIEDFASPFLVDARALAMDAQEKEPPTDEDVLTLAETTVVRVHQSGLSTRVHQEAHHVLTSRGVERMRARSVTYTPGDQILRIEQARVIRPDGTVLQARSEHERSLSEPWARLYFDQRARVLSFPDLSPGDVVEIVWRREDVSFANMFGDYFGDMALFQTSSPVVERSYVLVAPAEREIYFNEIDLPDVAHEKEVRDDGTQVLTWTATDIGKIVPEAGMPGWAEIAAFLHVSTYETWQEVAGWWWRLIEEQLRPTPALVSLAKRLVEDIPEEDILARVAAIHNYVVRHTRYVGLEFGIHGYKPYRVDQVHERRFGDCKDKAALMHSLLGAIGIDSKMVILRMRRLGRVPSFPASLAVFNHAILYVPKLELFLDGTGEFAGTGELPTQNHDAAVLVVDHDDIDASWFGYVPVPDAADNVASTNLFVSLSGDGSAVAEGTFEVTGSAAPGYRRAYQASEKRRHVYEQEWARVHPGVEVRALEMSGLDELEEPVFATFSLSIPRFARGDGGRLAFRPLGDGRGYTERFAALGSRRHDLILAFPFTTRHRLRVVLPDGWMVLDLPESETIESPYGRLVAEYHVEGNVVSIEIEIALTSSRVAGSDYAEFRDLLGRIDRIVSSEIRLAPAEASRAGVGAG